MNTRLRYRALLGAFILLLTACSPPPTDRELQGRGTWRIVNYWALWCTPCREEIPELNRLHQQPDVTVLGVNFDRKVDAELADHRRQLGIAFPSTEVDVEALLGPLPRVLPTTLIINPQGETVATLEGPQTEAQLVAVLSTHGRVQTTVIVDEK